MVVLVQPCWQGGPAFAFKKYGNIPDGCGWRFVGRHQGRKNRAATPDKPRSGNHGPQVGHAL